MGEALPGQDGVRGGCPACSPCAGRDGEGQRRPSGWRRGTGVRLSGSGGTGVGGGLPHPRAVPSGHARGGRKGEGKEAESLSLSLSQSLFLYLSLSLSPSRSLYLSQSLPLSVSFIPLCMLCHYSCPSSPISLPLNYPYPCLYPLSLSPSPYSCPHLFYPYHSLSSLSLSAIPAS